MVFGGLFSLYLCYQILKGVSLFKILCLDTEKIFSPKTSQNQKCLRLRVFWEFLCCRNTVVFQDKKCTKVRERRHYLAYAVRVLSPRVLSLRRIELYVGLVLSCLAVPEREGGPR